MSFLHNVEVAGDYWLELEASDDQLVPTASFERAQDGQQVPVANFAPGDFAVFYVRLDE